MNTQKLKEEIKRRHELLLEILPDYLLGLAYASPVGENLKHNNDLAGVRDDELLR